MEGIKPRISSEPALLVSSIGEVRIKLEVAVYPDYPGSNGSRDPVRHIQIVRHDSCCEAIFRGIGSSDCLLNSPASSAPDYNTSNGVCALLYNSKI